MFNTIFNHRKTFLTLTAHIYCKMRFKVLLILLPFMISAMWGCNLIDPEENTPTYINIDSFDFQIDNPDKEGSASQDIRSVWIYYNNSPVGVFDLPCRVPVITQGDEGLITVAPGIALNGLVDLQPQYPFFRFDSVVFETNPGKIFDYVPTTGYLSATQFRFNEDFETGLGFEEFKPGIVGETGLVQTKRSAGGDVFEGGASGLISLDANATRAEIISKKLFPMSLGESFIEISYKCSVPFQVGLYNTLNNGVETYNYIWGVKESDEWNKIYIELGTYTSENPGKDYRVMILTELTEGKSDGYVLLDNIKVVSF